MKQQKIALINDITGFGRCSTLVELPIINAMQIQCCPVPTAILSAHTGFSDYYMDDYTDKMESYIVNWQRLGLSFDGILTGFLSSEKQIDIVIQFIKDFKHAETKEQAATLLIVDPVMGDNGKIYSSYTRKLCEGMKKLAACADVLTPNLTEACNLLNISYPADGKITDTELLQICNKLSALHIVDEKLMHIVITGIDRCHDIGNFVYVNGHGKMMLSPKVCGQYPGTGDIFAAIIAGTILKGQSIEDAVAKAAVFINKSLAFTQKQGTTPNEGICFEEYLTKL